jgi:hypothetical protein
MALNMRLPYYTMHAFAHGQPLCLLYEDFYLVIGFTFYEFIKFKYIKKETKTKVHREVKA